MKVKLANVRLAFPHLFEPQTMQQNNGQKSEPKYNANFILDPKAHAAQIAEINAAIETVAKEKWKDKAPGIIAKLREEGRICYKPGPKLNGDGEVYDGFAGMHHISASNGVRPVVINRDKTPLTKEDGKPYGGCQVNATLEIWAQDNSFGKRINATLKGVQFVKDGDAFAGGTPGSPDDFDDLGVEENAGASLV